MNKQQYQKYLQSDHWKHTRELKLALCGWICEADDCHEKAREVHHLTYETLWDEAMTDLQALCRQHHWLAHHPGGDYWSGTVALPTKSIEELVTEALKKSKN